MEFTKLYKKVCETMSVFTYFVNDNAKYIIETSISTHGTDILLVAFVVNRKENKVINSESILIDNDITYKEYKSKTNAFIDKIKSLYNSTPANDMIKEYKNQ
jgi:hypothetical protein